MRRIAKSNGAPFAWGFALLCAFSLLSLVRLLLQKVPGHYRVFAGAGGALWHLQDPYNNTFGTGVGYYFYSPACALLVFGPVSFLPEKLGMIVYESASWAVFVWGAHRFWKSFGGRASLLQWFWAAITAQVVGAIMASKLELSIAGLLLGSISLIKDSGGRLNRSAIVGAVLLSAILNWKFQPLPVVGLLLLSRAILWRDWKLPVLFSAMLASWYLLPFAFFPVDYLKHIHMTWQSGFSTFLTESVFHFENVFAFLNHAFAVPSNFAQTQIASVVIGLLMVAYLVLWIYRTPPAERPAGSLLLSVALGTTFMTAFSPLGQNNALILYAPLLMCAFICLQNSARPRRWTGLISFACAIMILSYSDLVPTSARDVLRQFSVKALACLILGTGVAWGLWRDKTPRPTPASPLTS